MSPCATRHQLQRFLDAEPGCRDDEAIAAHLEGCPACERVLEALVAGRESAPRRERADERDAALIDRITRSGPWQPGPRMAAEGPGQRHGEAATWPVPDSAPLPAIPGFRILREIGRGGMGVVYEAEDQQLNRRVALKVLATHTLNQPNQVQRFDREARAAARLHHSHIVPVFGVGHQNGCHYYAMQYIEGVSLDRVIDELRKIRDGHDESGRSPSASECPGLTALMAEDGRPDRGVGRIGLQVAEALRYAHAHGVLHRDIKPSNLLLDASGNVWLADFGLAKAPEAEDLTGTGDVLGTIRYMAPERFRGRYDERSDVYGLGSTLYELVALRPAFEAADRFELIEEVRRAEPVPLSKRAPDVSRDLETIIHKAIEPEPDRRYAGAGALAEDLRRFLEDRPIRARRVSIPGRFLRWCRRNPWAAAFSLALGLGAIASTWQAIRATAAERAARESELRARDERDHARRAELRAQIERDRAEVSRNRAVAAVGELLVFARGGGSMAVDERLRPYLRASIDAGLRASRDLVRDLEGDPRAQLQLIEAYQLLARMQGTSGQHEAAIETAREVITIAERLYEPGHGSGAALALGQSLELLGHLLPDREAKLSALRRSTTIYQAGMADHSEEREGWMVLIALNHQAAGECEFQEGRSREAIAELLEARGWCDRLIEECGPDNRGRDILGLTERDLCRAYAAVHQFDEAFAAGRRAIEAFRGKVQHQPEDPVVRLALQQTYQDVGFIHLAAGRRDEAITLFAQARRTLEVILSRPGHLPSQIEQARICLAFLDQDMWTATEPDSARHATMRRELMSQALEVCDRISQDQPLTRELRRLQARACFHLAEYRKLDTGRPDLDLLRRSERLWEEIQREEPDDAEARRLLVDVRQRLAEEVQARGTAEGFPLDPFACP